MEPPLFPDWEPYFTFRNYLIEKLRLKTIVDSYYYELVIALFVIGNLVLIICSFFRPVSPAFYTALEIVFIVVFFLDIILRIISGGIEVFFANYFNIVDGIILIVSVILLCLRLDSSTMLKTIRLIRILRVTLNLSSFLGLLDFWPSMINLEREFFRARTEGRLRSYLPSFTWQQ